MTTVKEFRSLGVKFVSGDVFNYKKSGFGVELARVGFAAANYGTYDHMIAESFVPRENKGEQPVSDKVLVEATLRNGRMVTTGTAKGFDWSLSDHQSDIVTWKPSLNQPLLSKVKTETVKEFRDLGIEFVDGDTLNTGNMVGSWTDADTRFFEKSPSEYLGYTVESFAPRKNIKRVQPVGDDVTVDVVLRCKRKITKKAKEIEWGIDGCQGDVITWTPSLDQPSLQTETPEEKEEFDPMNKYQQKPDMRDLFTAKTALKNYKLALDTMKPYLNYAHVGIVKSFNDDMKKAVHILLQEKDVLDNLASGDSAVTEQDWMAIKFPTKPTYTQAMCENDELPPVGCDCLIMYLKDDDPQYDLCSVLFTSGSVGVVNILGESVCFDCSPMSNNMATFLPIPTEREEAIEEFIKLIHYVDENEQIAGDVYDASYRKCKK
jgi:hypothetical protein